MDSHRSACHALAAKLPTLPAPGKVLVGFDGFVDHIIGVVDKRHGPDAYDRVPTIASLAARIGAAAGRSANLELVITRSKIGGNGPIMADALAAQGGQVTCAGLLGAQGIHPVFQPMATRGSTLVSFGDPGVTDALEFDDGKLMLGKLETLKDLNAANIEKAFGGRDGLKAALRQPRLIATVNWTMSLAMTAIWRWLATDVLPGLRSDRPLWFVDLADPAKRPTEDLVDGLAALAGIQAHADVVLGLNGAEIRQVSAAVGLPYPGGEGEDHAAAEVACAALRDRLGVHLVMCHLTGSAACAWAGPVAGSARAEGFGTPRPKITTGAGDHFNAGFTSGLLSGLSPAEALLLGGATSGTYVRDAASPDRARLVAFLGAWAANGPTP